LLDPRLAATLAAMNAPPKPVTSPCTLVCVMNPATQLCYGCSRTVEEIAGWSGYSEAERARVIEQLKDRAKSAG
jgi:predicted Fe-S protein YdhL (DUF1289 family)